MDENELKQHLKSWTLPAHPQDLAQRISTRATALPQRLPPALRLQRRLAATFSDWHAELPYKLASLVLCAALGFAAGLNLPEPTDMELSAIAFGSGPAERLL